MQVRSLQINDDGLARPATSSIGDPNTQSLFWVDIEVSPDDTDELVQLTTDIALDALAVRDAVYDLDLPKVDDFGTSMLVVLHGLTEGQIRTYEIDCFLTKQHLVTIRREHSPSVDALWTEVQRRAELGTGGPDELLGRLADVMTRRLLSILDAFDDQVEHLIADALQTSPSLVADVTTVRSDLAVLRKVVFPQREVLDLLRHSTSSLIQDAGRRRFSDVFDVASRAVSGVDAARTALSEVLDAYRGAEARSATEVTKVLTVYAAIMLPLSLIAGFFGMNFENLPGTNSDNGWIFVSLAMAFVAVVSLGMFVSLGWMRRPSGRDAGSKLGHGLAEAARAPVQLVGAVFEISTMPLRGVTGTRGTKRPSGKPENPMAP